MRMSTRLLELGLSRRLTWEEIADVQADHEADLTATVDRAVADVEFTCWWNGSRLATNRVMAIYESLGGRRP